MMTLAANFSPTLSRYLAKIYTLNVLNMTVILCGVVFLFDVIELLRRAAKAGNVAFTSVLQMGVLKLPEMLQVIAPFIILFAALFTFWQLARRHELVVLRAAGISAWQFLLPIMTVAATIGILFTTALNPLGAVFYSHYNGLENKYLEQNKNFVAVFQDGIWLRQDQADGSGFIVIHAGSVDVAVWRLTDVMALYIDDNGSLTKRFDAQAAELKKGQWMFRGVTESVTGGTSTQFKTITVPTKLTGQDIEDSFAQADALGFWSLPNMIYTLDSTGFDSTKLRIHLQNLLAQPFLFAGMILLAAIVALRPQRAGNTFVFIVSGVMAGFGLFFISSFLQALGSSHQIPVFLAAWSPALLCLLLGSSALLTLEDG
jgi:lipopolysaccharide export system permease protein